MSVVIRIVGPYWRKINKDLEDASELLGASLIDRFKYIIAPMLAPVVFSSAILVFLFSFTSFGIIIIFGNDVNYTDNHGYSIPEICDA